MCFFLTMWYYKIRFLVYMRCKVNVINNKCMFLLEWQYLRRFLQLAAMGMCLHLRSKMNENLCTQVDLQNAMGFESISAPIPMNLTLWRSQPLWKAIHLGKKTTVAQCMLWRLAWISIFHKQMCCLRVAGVCSWDTLTLPSHCNGEGNSCFDHMGV